MELSTFIIFAVIVACGGSCSLAGTWWSKKWREEHKKKKANKRQSNK
ncbi:MAG: hypothetical protein ACLU9Q_17205 [Marvinbryantia sp.]|nr:hypothetical protein [uncultured Marvinbryantia sp.]